MKEFDYNQRVRTQFMYNEKSVPFCRYTVLLERDESIPKNNFIVRPVSVARPSLLIGQDEG